MRRVAFCIFGLLTTATPGIAAFEPEISAVCVPKPIQPGTKGRIDINKLVDELLASRGIGFGDLRGTITYDDKRAAISDPPTFCRSHRGVCGDEARRKLTLAYQDLYIFIQTHRKPVEVNSSGFEISKPGADGRPITVPEFLSGTVLAVCVVAPLLPGQEKPSVDGKSNISQRLMVRKKVTDLRVAQSSDEFKDLDRARISVESDFLANTNSYSIEGVVGYSISQVTTDTSRAELIGFGTYTRQFVAGSNTPSSPDVYNIGGGLLGSLTFLAGGERQNIQFFTQYMRSERTLVDTLAGNLVYKLLTGWAIGQPVYLGGSTVAFQFLPPQLRYSYNFVLATGNGFPPAPTKDYQSFGGKLEMLLADDGGLFDRFSLRTSYEYLYLVGGPITNADRFETTLSYTLPKQEFWSFDLKFWAGRNLDTFEKEKAMTAGVGFKY